MSYHIEFNTNHEADNARIVIPDDLIEITDRGDHIVLTIDKGALDHIALQHVTDRFDLNAS